MSVLEDVVASGERGDAPPLDLDAPFTVVHTSGSTGRPKAILHSVGNHVWSARGVIDALEVGPSSRWLLDLPLYHVGGLGIVMRCVLAGATMAVPSRSVPAAERVERFRPTHASFVSAQLRRLLDAGADLSCLQAVLLGGSSMPAALIDRALEAGVPAVVSYGLTEMTSTVTATSLPSSRADLATSGVPLPHRDVRISDDGEIEVGGPARYVGRVLEGEILPAPEWHPTGDIGRFDSEGRLVVTGRRDLQFVSGGENVHPEPIEAALLALDGVLEAVVVPVPDLEFGHRPAAFVRLEDGDSEARPRGRASFASWLHSARRRLRVGRGGGPKTGPPGAHARSGAPGGGIRVGSGLEVENARCSTTGRCGSPRCRPLPAGPASQAWSTR